MSSRFVVRRRPFRPAPLQLEARRLLTAYDYTRIGDGFYGDRYSSVSINNAGQVAYQRDTSNYTAQLVEGSGGPLTSLTVPNQGLYDETGGYREFGPKIDDQGVSWFRW
jgi:hypothetical protein